MNSYPPESVIASYLERFPSSSTGLAQLNDAILWAQNHGRNFLEVPGGKSSGQVKILDNSATGVVIPAGFNLQGMDRDSHVVLLPKVPAAGEACIDYGPYSTVNNINWQTKNPDAGGWGTSPSASQGLPRCRPKSKITNCFFRQMHAAFWAQGDNIEAENNEAIDCFTGWFRSGGTSQGNCKLINNRFTGNRFCAIFLEAGRSEDSFYTENNYFAFTPLGIFMPGAGAVAALTNWESHGDAWEECWYRHIEVGNRFISGDIYTPRTGKVGLGFSGTDRSIPNGTLGDTLMNPARKNTNFAVSTNNMDAASLDNTNPVRTSSDKKLTVYGSGGDSTNGPWRTGNGGTSGIFELVTS